MLPPQINNNFKNSIFGNWRANCLFKICFLSSRDIPRILYLVVVVSSNVKRQNDDSEGEEQQGEADVTIDRSLLLYKKK